MSSAPHPTAGAEVVELCQDLIRIDTSNFGHNAPSPGERPAAEYVAAKLAEVGIEAQLFEPLPKRTTLVADWAPPGVDATIAPLLIHVHTDVVPAPPDEWTYPPFAAEIADGCIWGRGAVDMKNMCAMVLAVVRSRQREHRPPRRPIRLIYFADEEASGNHGSKWLVANHPELIADCSEAIGEVGGFSLTVSDTLRLYPIQVAEKGIQWLRLTASGTAGHGSMRNPDNAVTKLAAAVARLGDYRWPIVLHPAQEQFLAALSDALGVQITPENAPATLAPLGGIARLILACFANSVNPTILQAGYLANVIPAEATAQADGRVIPGQLENFTATVRDLVGPGIRIEPVSERAPVETEFSGDLVAAMQTALACEDPGARAVPYLFSGGTDAKEFAAQLGVRSFGFCPMRLPADFDFTAQFHGVDERVPIDALQFGTRVLDRFLDLA